MNYTLIGIIALTIVVAAPITFISWSTWNWLATHMPHGICGMHGYESMHEYCEEEAEEHMNREETKITMMGRVVGKSLNTIYVESGNKTIPLILNGAWKIKEVNDNIDVVNSSTIINKYLTTNETIILVFSKMDSQLLLREIILPDKNLVIMRDVPVQSEEYCSMMP